jgi:hypothetical protein
MDFMASLSPSKGFDVIIIVVDRFSKMAHFIPTKESAMTQEMGRLFFMHVFKHRGLPKDIMLNRNPKFTSKFWRALWKCMGSKFKISTSIQPQTDGRIERVNLVIQ